MDVLLTPAEMAEADRLTIQSGTPGMELMNVAGRAVADCCIRMIAPSTRILVLCGPGNNGGDGFVAARILNKRGYSLAVMVLGKPERLRGDAKQAYDEAVAAGVEIVELEIAELKARLSATGLVIDALFGAGLDRPLSDEAAETVALVNEQGVKVVAVDLPSGVSGESGAVLGVAIKATRTVTFFKRKPGHVLMPGRVLCGPVDVEDIGIKAAVLERIAPKTFVNAPDLWRHAWHPPVPGGHKYSRGHAVVVSGPVFATGAARLAATAALRAGAGLVTVAATRSAAFVHATHLTAVMIHACRDSTALRDYLEDPRFNAVAIGPAAGIGAETRSKVEVCLDGRRSVVLDADALTSFKQEPRSLFALVEKSAGQTVMTPHEGEFSRLFGSLLPESLLSKPGRARKAAELSGAVIVLKGPDTVIAAPDGRAAITVNAGPWLATAGSGDVLCGVIAGLLAQGLPAFEAAAMGVWLHGEAGGIAGAGLIAEDLLPALKTAIEQLCDEV